MPDKCPDPLAPAAKPDEAGRYFGKYRGVVLDNIDIDPEFLGMGRVLVEVPQVPGSVLNFAMPSVPYAGLEVGFWMIPPIGANVWVEFEGGNPNFPIWSGCFWELGEFPFAEALNPLDPALVKIIRTDAVTMVMNDTPLEGGYFLEITEPAVEFPITVAMDTLGVQINNGVANVLMVPEEGITLEVAETVIAMTEAAMEIASAEINVTAENTSIESLVEIVGNVEITGAVEIEGNVEITGAVEIEGDLEVTGATEMLGDLAVVGAVEVSGDISALAAIEVLGDAALLGALEVVGDVSVLGAQEIVGDLAVLGAIEGILFGAVVPPI
jgi:cytoskeletal protein CcmA (bactofilin family)